MLVAIGQFTVDMRSEADYVYKDGKPFDMNNCSLEIVSEIVDGINEKYLAGELGVSSETITSGGNYDLPCSD